MEAGNVPMTLQSFFVATNVAEKYYDVLSKISSSVATNWLKMS